MSHRSSAGALLALAMTGALIMPDTDADPSAPAAECPAPEARKKSGLGGLLGAAGRAGAGDFLGRGLIPEGDAARAVGEVAQRAIEAAGNGAEAQERACPQPRDRSPQRDQPQQREWRAVD
ncbi:hypothetical protein D3C87_274780 [compost metagenome]